MANMCKNRAMAAFVHPSRHHVAVLVRHGMLVMELGIVHRRFGQARSASGEPLYEVVTRTLEPGPVRTDADFTIPIDRGPEVLAEADTVIVPASLAEYEPMARVLTPHLAAALDRIPADARNASICTGAFVLAAAGLLDGRRATTHWRSADDLQNRFPEVEVDPCVLYTDDGNVLTSAGVASGIDLVLHMIRRDHGAAVANEVARGTVVSPHREGGAGAGAGEPAPPADAARTSRPRGDEHPDVHPPLPRRGRHLGPAMADAATDRARPPAAGGVGPAGRPRRDGGRLRHGGIAAPALPGRPRSVAERIPHDVPRRADGAGRLNPGATAPRTAQGGHGGVVARRAAACAVRARGPGPGAAVPSVIRSLTPPGRLAVEIVLR